MVRYFWRSPEGEEAYKKIGIQQYPTEIMDREYESYLEKTKNSPKKDTKKVYQKMIRIKIAKDGNEGGKEYIVYAQQDTRRDRVGNIVQRYRGNLGIYPEPIPHYEMVLKPEEDYIRKREMTGIIGYKTRYAIPFTKANADEMHQFCIDGETQYLIKRGDIQFGTKFSVASFKDWRDGDFEELEKFGHIATPAERQQLEDEKAGKVGVTATKPYS